MLDYMSDDATIFLFFKCASAKWLWDIKIWWLWWLKWTEKRNDSSFSLTINFFHHLLLRLISIKGHTWLDTSLRAVQFKQQRHPFPFYQKSEMKSVFVWFHLWNIGDGKNMIRETDNVACKRAWWFIFYEDSRIINYILHFYKIRQVCLPKINYSLHNLYNISSS